MLERPTEQAHLVLGMRSLRRDDPDRYALTVLNQVLGGGMSSRLFQEVREQRGLAYSVYSYRAAFEETGALAIYAGTSPERVDELLQVLDAQLERLVADGGVTDRELVAAKGHLAGFAVAVARELEQPDAPPRPQRADAGRDARPSTSSSPRSTRSRPTTSPGSSTGWSPPASGRLPPSGR